MKTLLIFDGAFEKKFSFSGQVTSLISTDIDVVLTDRRICSVESAIAKIAIFIFLIITPKNILPQIIGQLVCTLDTESLKSDPL